jgi:hypothetical protein
LVAHLEVVIHMEVVVMLHNKLDMGVVVMVHIKLQVAHLVVVVVHLMRMLCESVGRLRSQLFIIGSQ